MFGGFHDGVRGFNGQFANIVFGIGKGRFVSDHQGIQSVYTVRTTVPRTVANKRVDVGIEDTKQSVKVPVDINEYAIGGWFKSTQTVKKFETLFNVGVRDSNLGS